LIHRHRRWRQLSAIGALAYRPSRRGRLGRSQVYLALHPGPIRSPQVVRFLRHLRRHLRGPICLIWDGLNVHRSVQTRAYLEAHRRALHVYRLPAYAPDLNPVEGLWAWLKGSAVPNLCADGLAPLRAQVRAGQRRLRRRPDLLVAFLHKAGLFFRPNCQ